ncbi:hypothetical protein Syun_018848 [Stephania yunnanensis]|uniref:Uncharacterized protein n=1 Tax=Stephania yunnanensis TaxID=152371 RepID=A0AAP0IVC8_9MAGN
MHFCVIRSTPHYSIGSHKVQYKSLGPQKIQSQPSIGRWSSRSGSHYYETELYKLATLGLYLFLFLGL